MKKDEIKNLEIVTNNVDENGIDRSLIEWVKSLTLEEKLNLLSDCANDIMSIRDENPYL